MATKGGQFLISFFIPPPILPLHPFGTMFDKGARMYN